MRRNTHTSRFFLIFATVLVKSLVIAAALPLVAMASNGGTP